VSHSGGSLRKAQRQRRFAVGKLLEMAKQHNFTVVIFQLRQRVLKPGPKLAPQCLGGGRQRLVAQLCGQIEGRAVIEVCASRSGFERPLAINGSLGRLPVSTVGIDHMVPRDLPQPKVEGENGIAEILC
jgi:hypothetical protein